MMTEDIALHPDLQFAKWLKTFGRIYELIPPFGGPTTVIVTDPAAIKEICQDRNFPKSPTYDDLVPLIGTKSILTTEGTIWRHQRKSFNPGFSTFFLKQMLPVFCSKTRTFLGKLARAADDRTEVRIHEHIMLLTSDVICKIAFGLDVDVQTSDHPLHDRFIKLMDILIWYIVRPPLKWTRALPWNQAEIKKATKEFDAVLMDLVRKPIEEAQARARASAGSKKTQRNSEDDASIATGTVRDEDEEQLRAKVGANKDILSVAVSVASESGDGTLDIEEVASQLKTFFFAGFDTSSSALAWCAYHLSRRPELERRLVDELYSVFGDSDRDPTNEDLSRLTFLDKLVKETLRLNPPAASARWGVSGETILGKYDVSNSIVYMPTYVLHRDPEIYGKDAEEFNPDRWTEEFTAKLDPYAYIPFSKGPRDCIGQRLALFEIKTILAMVYRSYTFRWTKDFEEMNAYSITSHPKHGVPLLPIRRTDYGARK
ncbi:cytochrome P450 [Hyaloraphidium curvatum]|nr:cytochrome P450 [Hyaloraphidium curvatum]